MNGKKYIVVVLALILVLLTVSTVSARNERIDFTFYGTCDWENVDWGREIINGQGNYIEKHFKQTCYNDNASIPQVTGTSLIDLNLNIVGNGVWKYTGKFQMTSDEGGVWDLNCVYPWPSDFAQCVGKGEGIYEGWQIFMDGGGMDMKWTGYIVDYGQ